LGATPSTTAGLARIAAKAQQETPSRFQKVATSDRATKRASSKGAVNRPWTPREDYVVSIVSPEVAAEKLGRSINEVVDRILVLRRGKGR
jgi:hypothetical protein